MMTAQDIRDLLIEINYEKVGINKDHYYVEGRGFRVYVAIYNDNELIIIREYTYTVRKIIIVLPINIFTKEELKDTLIDYRDAAFLV